MKIEFNGTSPDFTIAVSIPSNKWKFIFEEKILSCNSKDGEITTFLLRKKLLTVSDQYVLLKQSEQSAHVSTSTTGEGNNPKWLELVRFTNCSVPTRNKGKIIAEFLTTSPKTKKRILMLKGDFGMNDLLIHLGDPKKEGERPVGRIRKLKIKTLQDKESSESYRLDYAGGVDIIVLMGLFLVLDDVRVKNPAMQNVPLLLK